MLRDHQGDSEVVEEEVERRLENDSPWQTLVPDRLKIQ